MKKVLLDSVTCVGEGLTKIYELKEKKETLEWVNVRRA